MANLAEDALERRLAAIARAADVTVEGKRVFEDGVNVASRIRELAERFADLLDRIGLPRA